MKYRPVLYPFLLAIYPILALYAKNRSIVTIDRVYIPLIVALGLTLLIWGGIAVVSKNPQRAGLWTILIVILIGTLEQSILWASSFCGFVNSFWVAHTPRLNPLVVYIPYSAALIYLGSKAIKAVKEPRKLTSVLNVFACMLILMTAFDLVQTKASTVKPIQGGPPALAQLPASGNHPDIYYIILDSFGRSEVLNQNFQYDLAPFLKHLEERGFYVARESTSNYSGTHLSLTSSLNSMHHTKSPDPTIVAAAITQPYFTQNAVYKSLKPLGYQFVSFATGFDPTDTGKTDIYLSPFNHMTEYERTLLVNTPLKYFVSKGKELDIYDMSRERALFLFDHLPEVAKLPGPKLTFAHILLPHPPFIFGENGEDVSPHHVAHRWSDGNIYHEHYRGETPYVNGYAAQVSYLIKRVDVMIDQLLKNSPEPPVIIIQSDHGSGLNFNVTNDKLTDHHERMSITNAFYFPDRKYDELYPSITPVNSFRMVLNHVFGTKIERLPDTNFYSTAMTPLNFVDVTDRVRLPLWAVDGKRPVQDDHEASGH